MKTTLRILKLTIILCGFFATTAVFGQTTYTWTNSAGGDLATAANWNPNGVPNGPNSDTMRFDGQSTGPVAATSNTGAQVGYSGGAWGLKVHLTSYQTSPVNFYTTVANTASPGIRLSDITIDGDAGSFSLGNSSTTNALDTIWGGVAGQVHNFVNNSTNAATIYPNLRIRFGGGGAHTFAFQGTGDWIVNNYLTGVEAYMLLAMLGTGTFTWTGTNVPYAAINGYIGTPVIINEGKVILKSYNLLGTQNIQNNGSDPSLLQYDAASGAGTLSGVISGPLALTVSSGTLTLSGASTYTGNTTLSGGEVIVNRAENPGVSGPLGTNGTISFTGGTLGFSTNNTFDYSSRFSTAANQAYNFDTGIQNVTFATGLGSSGGTLTKAGAGTLALSGASTYDGATTVSAGKLVFQGSKTGSGNITVADGAALGVTVTGTQVTPGTLTLGTSTGCTLEFNSISSTTTAPLAAGILSSGGTVTVNINSGTVTVGQCYPLLTWTSGSAPTVSLGTVNGARGVLFVSGNTLYLCIVALTYIWTGSGDGTNFYTAGNWSPVGPPDSCWGATAEWDGATTSNLLISLPSVYSICDFPVGMNLVLTANQTNSVQIVSAVASTGLHVNGITNNSASAALTLGDDTANSLGILARPTGGTTRYWVNNSAAPVTINPNVRMRAGAGAGATLDFGGSGDWIVNNYLRNDNSTVSSIQKDGSSTFIWTAVGTAGNSAISSVAIYDGTLILKNSGLLADQPITNNATLIFDAAAQSQTLGGVISGTGVLKVSNGTLTLSGANTYTGTTTVSNGTLQVGAGGTTGSVGTGDVTNNGVLVFNRSDSVAFGNVISGAGSVVQYGSGTLTFVGANTYTGSTTVSNGTLVVSSVGGNMNVSGGTLVPGGVGSVGTLNVAGAMNISSGTVLVSLNKALSPSNSVVSVAGSLNNSGGTLKLLNFGPDVVVGDKFTIFNQPVAGGAAMTIVSPGVISFANNLAVDGSVTVTSIASSPATVTTTISGGQLTLSWPAAWTGLHLQVQTNSLTVGLSTNWVTIPGSDAGNSYMTTHTNASAFYRLAP